MKMRYLALFYTIMIVLQYFIFGAFNIPLWILFLWIFFSVCCFAFYGFALHAFSKSWFVRSLYDDEIKVNGRVTTSLHRLFDRFTKAGRLTALTLCYVVFMVSLNRLETVFAFLWLPSSIHTFWVFSFRVEDFVKVMRQDAKRNWQ